MFLAWRAHHPSLSILPTQLTLLYYPQPTASWEITFWRNYILCFSSTDYKEIKFSSKQILLKAEDMMLHRLMFTNKNWRAHDALTPRLESRWLETRSGEAIDRYMSFRANLLQGNSCFVALRWEISLAVWQFWTLVSEIWDMKEDLGFLYF